MNTTDRAPDGIERLCTALYGKVTAGAYLGGPDAKMLHDAATEIERLREALMRFKLRGIHADTNPTMIGQHDTAWWYGYLERADRTVKTIASEALADIATTQQPPQE